MHLGGGYPPLIRTRGDLVPIREAPISQIREGKTFQIPSLIQAGQQFGMQSMDAALEALVLAKTVALEAAVEKALDKEYFLRGAKAKLDDAL